MRWGCERDAALASVGGARRRSPLLGGRRRAARRRRGEPDATYGRIDGDVDARRRRRGARSAARGAARGGRAPAALPRDGGALRHYEDGALFGERRRADARARRRARAAPALPRALAHGARARARARSTSSSTRSASSSARVLAQPAGRASRRAPGLRSGSGSSVPLLARASGPWLGVPRRASRWSDARARRRAPAAIPADRAGVPLDHAGLAPGRRRARRRRRRRAPR